MATPSSTACIVVMRVPTQNVDSQSLRISEPVPSEKLLCSATSVGLSKIFTARAEIWNEIGAVHGSSSEVKANTDGGLIDDHQV
jgi:hypothetical protein